MMMTAQIDRIFDATEMRVVLINLTSENMNDAQIAAATEFLNSDVGMRANTLKQPRDAPFRMTLSRNMHCRSLRMQANCPVTNSFRI